MTSRDPLADGLEAVIFNVGNTLFYLDYARLLDVLGRHGIARELGPDDAALAERRARPALSRWLSEQNASTERPESFRRYIELALAEARVTTDARTFDSAFEEICVEHRKSNFFAVPAPGAFEAVLALERRWKLAVVSNAGGRVAKKLEAAGFGPHLLTVVDSGLEGVEKPDARIFHRGCERAGVEPARALYVGDLEWVDFFGATRAGLRAVLVDPAGAYAAQGSKAPLVPDVAALARRLLASG